MLKDIGPGSRSGLITHRRGRQMVEVGDWLYFAANDWVFGAELWRTDGTAANTQMVYDLAPGAASALPREFLLDSGSLLFTADDGFHGEELFRIEVPAHALELGPGCAPRASPRLSATTPQLARRLTLRLDHPNSLPNAAGLLVVGWQPARPVPMGSGCTLFVDLGVPYLTEPVWLNNGRWSIAVQVPGSPSLHGVDFAAQAVIGPSAQPPFGLDLSNGVLLALRR
jgi:ELWxxDGT repeat protein